MKIKMKYYNIITGKYEQIYVKEELARFMIASDKKMKREQMLYNKYTVSMDTVISKNGDGVLTIEDTLTDSDEEDENAIIEKEKIKSALWRIVDTLEEKQREIIIDIFVNEKEQKVIAEELGITSSAVNQIKKTALIHLQYKLCTDKEFMETYFHKRHRAEFDNLVLQTAKEMNKPEGLVIDINGVEEVTKLGTQFLKDATKHNLDLDENMLGLFKLANGVVRDFVKDFKKENGNASKMVITPNYELKVLP